MTYSNYATGFGDVDYDGDVDIEDARLVLRYSIGSETPTSSQYVLADVDGDSAVTVNDSREVLRYSTGLITQFSLFD